MLLKLPNVIGHRGACGYAPENTVASMLKARELGAQWVEFDVMLTGCGEAIIIHDFTLERTTNGQGQVSTLHYPAIAELDCGSWFSQQFLGERVPTLSSLLDSLTSLSLAINIEIKPNFGCELRAVLKAIEVLEQCWSERKNDILVSSFSRAVIKNMHYLYPEYHLGFIIDEWNPDWEEIVERYQCVSLHVDHSVLTEERVNQIKSANKLVLAYTVNDACRAKELFSWGVDSVFSDFPDRITR